MTPEPPSPPVPRDPDGDRVFDDEALARGLGAVRGPATKDGLLPEDEEAFLAVMDRLAAQDAADDPELRSLLAEVADAVVAASDDEAARLGPHARAAALSAWEASAAVGATPGCVSKLRGEAPRLEAPSAPTRTARRLAPALRWAALLVLVLGAGLYAVVSNSPEASAHLRLTAFYRFDRAVGRPEATWGRTLRVGEELVSAPGELIALRLSDRGAVVLQGGGTLSVVEASATGPCSTPDANLQLRTGEARLMSDGEPVCLVLPSGTRLVIEKGRGLLSRTAGRVVLALADGAEGRLLRDGREEALVGPAHAALTSGGLEDLEAIDPDRFRVPAFLDRLADASRRNLARLVDARRWRVILGTFERRGRDLGLQPAHDAPRAEVAWRPSPFVRSARTLRVELRADDGIGVRVPGLGIEARLGPDAPTTPGSEGYRSVDLHMPDDWYERLRERGEELVIAVMWPEGTMSRRAVHFHGTAFRFERVTETGD